MREIKFRAWIVRDDEYSIVEYMENDSRIFDDPLGEHEKGNIILLQYTGLKDKNSKEIYEGDIVKFCDFDSLRTGGNTSDKIQVAAVIESECSWIVNNDRYADFLYQAWANDSELEVIGNIYENPELLEVGLHGKGES